MPEERSRARGERVAQARAGPVRFRGSPGGSAAGAAADPRPVARGQRRRGHHRPARPVVHPARRRPGAGRVRARADRRRPAAQLRRPAPGAGRRHGAAAGSRRPRSTSSTASGPGCPTRPRSPPRPVRGSATCGRARCPTSSSCRPTGTDRAADPAVGRAALVPAAVARGRGRPAGVEPAADHGRGECGGAPERRAGRCPVRRAWVRRPRRRGRGRRPARPAAARRAGRRAPLPVRPAVGGADRAAARRRHPVPDALLPDLLATQLPASAGWRPTAGCAR